ncbi:MAG: QueT transporter family protein [Clostridia bacterium]|nr:QueT transporter family protein [Clostridia bacterium]
MNFSVKTISRAAVVAALYAALCFFLKPLSFGVIQLRIAEVLCTLPIFMPEAVLGLFIGCVISNLLGGASVVLLDAILGSLTTLVAAILTWHLYKKTSNMLIAFLPPVILNGLVVGTYVPFIYTDFSFAQSPVILLFSMVSVALGEAIVIYVLGLPFSKALKRSNFLTFR